MVQIKYILKTKLSFGYFYQRHFHSKAKSQHMCTQEQKLFV